MARTWTSPNNIVAAHGTHNPSRAIQDAEIIARFHRQLEGVKIGLFNDNDNDTAGVSLDNNDIDTDPHDTYPSKVSAAKRKAVKDEQRLVAFNIRGERCMPSKLRRLLNLRPRLQ